MSSISSFLLALLPVYGYWLVFAAMFASAVILPLPMGTLLAAAGAFASQGYFNLYILISGVILANIFGDVIDFFLARKYGHKIIDKMHVHIPNHFARVESLVQKHRGVAIFFTRFMGYAGPITNVLCGYIGIRFRVFIFYDLIGNIISDSFVICLGYFLGVQWEKYIAQFNVTGYIIGGIVVIFVVVWWWRRGRRSN
jgi:membrane protein DedA with SNARE-associated domain